MSSSDDNVSSDEEHHPRHPPIMTHAPPPSFGKHFPNNDSDSDDDDDDAVEAIATAEVVAQPPPPPQQPPRGKELRIVAAATVEKKSPRKKVKKQTASSSSPARKSKKRKEPPVAAADDSDSEGDDAVATAVVVKDVTSTTASAKSSSPKKRDTKKKQTASKSSRKKQKTSSSSSQTKQRAADSATAVPLHKLVSAETLRAAEAAREALRSKVTSLPHRVNDYFTIRCLGRIVDIASHQREELTTSVAAEEEEPTFSSPSAIYPVGFSCDRYEFSPVHGRIVKIRCDILDGRMLKSMNLGGLKSISNGADDATPLEDKENNNFFNGPVFRIMWGEGIEADHDDDSITFPFRPSDTTTSRSVSSEKPTVGCRVAVKFDKGQVYEGKITKVSVNSKKSSAVETVWNIGILYDDGVVENTSYPDMDITLFPPGFAPIQQTKGHVTELNGKPVHSILAKTPLEAWGKTLLSLGLIDEIIYEEAMDTLDKSREEAFAEARERIESANKKRREDRNKVKHGHATRQSTDTVEKEDKEDKSTDDNAEDTNNLVEEKPSEPPSEQELELREKLDRLKKELADAKQQSRSASVDLARARISKISPFAANPFDCGPDATSQDQSLMTAAVKKEKSKMGNTGNKRKVVTPTTMLDRSDTFFCHEIECLIEGMTNSELAPLYVFHDNRSVAISNQAWSYEAKIRHQNAIQKKLEKQMRAAESAEAKAQYELEKSKRRKEKEEREASKKRQREEEEEQKKMEKAEKRLGQITAQMDERIIKESFFANEKAVMSYVKSVNKEFVRRRKVADSVIAHQMDQRLQSSSTVSTSTAASNPIYNEKLPTIADRIYDEAVVRIWDFLHCFSDAFVTEGSNDTLPTLDSLQDAIDNLRKGRSNSKMHRAAVALLEKVAIMICQAISPGLTKQLAAAAYLSDVNKGSADETASLPVTSQTWREVARMSIIGDLLIDLGYSKVESANIVKGYRSGGHPNSKEAKRWKKVEDSSVVMLYQQLNDESNQYRRRIVTARLSAPSTPSCLPSDWRFFLHNIHSRTPNSVAYIKSNVEKSLSALKKNPQGATQDQVQTHISELERCLSILQQTPSDHSADPNLLKAKKVALDVLDSTRGTFLDKQRSKGSVGNQSKEQCRSNFGLLKNYELSSEQYRQFELAKEDYMVAALKLKEELENKSKDDAAVLSDDEEDDEEGEHQEDKLEVDSKLSEVDSKPDVSITDESAKLASTAETSSDSNATANGNSAEAMIEPTKKNKTDVTTDKSPVNPEDSSTGVEPCGMQSDYDFCADISHAPEAIRRCLAVVRTLCSSNSSDPFIYPVDPQLYPGYYESVMSPVSLYDVGKFLQKSVNDLLSNEPAVVDQVVAECGRMIRKIFHNSLAYNTGNKEHLTMNSAEEMLRLFERLFFDWVLAPFKPALKDLDDDKCIDSHNEDVMSMVIICDACEGKYNMKRLKPPLKKVPAGEWYCPRCIQGRCWATEDPRLGRQVRNGSFLGTVESCRFVASEAGEYNLVYCIGNEFGSKQLWDLRDVDKAIVGDPVAPIAFLDALAECSGYSFGRDAGILGNTLPLSVDPFVDDKAARSALLSNVYQDSVGSCISLMHPLEDLTCNEWVTLLMLLTAKCSSSETVLELASTLENTYASTLASTIMTFWRNRGAKNIVPDIYADDSDEEQIPSIPPIESIQMEKKPSDAMEIDSEKSVLPAVDDNQMVQTLHPAESNDSSNDGAKPTNDDISDKPAMSPEEELRRKKRETGLFAKTIRQKKREESLVGYYVQNSLKSTVASFEEDPISSFMRSTICNQEEGLDIAAVRCRQSCHFCKLSDLAICSPMCRVPNDSEWNEVFPQAIHERNSYLIARLPTPASELYNPAHSGLEQVSRGKVCIVRVRVGGELVADKATSLDYPSKVLDQPLTQFLPKNPLGFQSELQFRAEADLSVVTGSLTAHEVCAIAAHKSRKEAYLRDCRSFCKTSLTRNAAMSCGKSIPIGQDQSGRTYWLFKAEPTTLFICDLSSDCTLSGNKPVVKWHKLSAPEAIASVIVGLGKDPPSESLKDAYPEASSLIKDRVWSTMLMRRALKNVSEAEQLKGATSHKATEGKDAKLEAPFVEDEDVFVESENGTLLWDAVVVDVSKDSGNGQVNGYLVHYKGWSSRFDSWVHPDRVVEANNENLIIQKEILDEFNAKMEKAPTSLQGMFALRHLQRTNWKNSNHLTARDLHTFVQRPGAFDDEKSLSLLKGSILLIEAALPSGAIEYWPDHAALLWSNFVKNARGPESLLKCVLLLEDAISPKYIRAEGTQMFAALPRQFRAMGEASVHSVALRVAVLDRSLNYS